MSALEDLGVLPFILLKKRNGNSYKAIANELRVLFPTVRGLSVRSLKRFCRANQIYSTSRLSDEALDTLVTYGVGRVGPTYGRKMMTGFLTNLGFKVSQQRVGLSLKRVNPLHHSRRQSTTHRSINPTPYYAAYFGEKIHVDQNEKIVMYGVTHVCAVDGYSGKIVGFISMPVKSNTVIYEKLFREVTIRYGLWDQVRIDKGREWYLSLFVAKALSPHRYCTNKPPVLQTSSKQNHIIERLWVEVNKRINYPLKGVLNKLVQDGHLCMENQVHQYCCSWLSLHVTNIGAQIFVASWNSHPIPGGRKRAMQRGIPNRLMNRDNRAKRIDPSVLPTTEEAVQQYCATGGHISEPCQFGTDPLGPNDELQEIRLNAFCSKFSFQFLFCDVVNGHGDSFRDALLFLINVTNRLAYSV